MTPLDRRGTPSKLIAQIAVVGMSMAVVALGALAVWAGITSQNSASGLSDAGVQTSGHLRAVQALGILDTSTDALEEQQRPSDLAALRRAQRVLLDALDRMGRGELPQARRLAEQSEPLVGRLTPVISRFLARAPGSDGTRLEEEMETIITELQVLLNDLNADPSALLDTKLDSVTASERTVRATAFVLIPLGLGGAVACSLLLSSYRRRSEAAMAAALDVTSQEARTDALTGLPNRRALLEELDHLTSENQPFILALADLNGFKRYNDRFGHPAGDALLKRLGHNLAVACEGLGTAARLGGDEFCVVLVGEGMPADRIHRLLRAALSEEGEGFRITAESGLASVPADARTPGAALRLADSRMYVAKASSRPCPEQAMSVTLRRMLDESHPGLGTHVEEVTELSVACARVLALSPEEVRSVERAGELHDVGKVAIPSAILNKDGPLNEQEWTFMKRHSEIGERILGGDPSLEHIASVVRSSHERWDGGGYPDGLAGEEIPLAARIIFVADSFCAMTEDRPYADAQTTECARREIIACSGTQFDPTVVTAFVEALEARSGPALAGAGGAHRLPA